MAMCNSTQIANSVDTEMLNLQYRICIIQRFDYSLLPKFNANENAQLPRTPNANRNVIVVIVILTQLIYISFSKVMCLRENDQ